MSLRTAAKRWAFNFFPAFRRTGARITHMSDDERRVEVRLPLKRATRNYVGTIYGGVMYSALDGILMVMFIRLLGKGYIVWDKAGRIEYLKPGRSALLTTIEITEEDLQFVRDTLEQQSRLEKEFTLEWRDANGDVCCRVHKLLYFRRREQKTGQTL
ncbi:MAG: DUF4442 domain-containing protein [Gammaproteobacteria bacterium]|nr:DUF4442 domain-containing protein [Gammaproteobacteria bacterium]NNF62395.1 DUF4442 domain-containing protein [Gammaproteobacteria bacterium]NNM20915.1 DUF4442 domain-containing protein [Gammaproteobacteria bacterium]